MKEYGAVYENVDLKKYSTLKVGPIVKYLVMPYDESDLVNLIKYLKNNNIKYYILGNCSNVIMDDNYFDGVIIKLDNLDKIEIKKNVVTAQCGVLLPVLVKRCLDENLTSLAFASMIPGCVGASVMGNAGCYNECLLDHVQSIRVINKDLNIEIIDKKDIKYDYRYTNLKGNIILSVTFKLESGDKESVLLEIKERNEKRRASQPLDKKSVGSIFKNPRGLSAGKLIDDLHLKGYSIGGAQISQKHANFIINEKHATFSDVIDLIDYIKNAVKKEYNIELETEPIIIKWDEI